MIFKILGRLAWAGLFKNGTPYGASWRGLEGGGFLYGKVGSKGLFEGNNNAYIYCDMSTVLKGKFVNGKMVNAVPTKIKEVYFEKCRAILRLKFCKPKYKAQEYQYWPSTLDEVGELSNIHFSLKSVL